MIGRIYADFSSGGSPGRGACWCLRWGSEKRPLDSVAEGLNLRDGMQVTLYYEDPSEEFEVFATLFKTDSAVNIWHALPDWTTYRLIRGQEVAP